jgi:hypothetical protein
MAAVTLAACKQNEPASTVDTPPKAAAAQSLTAVTKVVFVDKEMACECTQNRINETWTALQAALGTPAVLPVERVHVDTQAALAAPYTAAKPLLVPPGIYFVDANGAVIELLQGEVKADQIKAILQGRLPSLAAQH